MRMNLTFISSMFSDDVKHSISTFIAWRKVLKNLYTCKSHNFINPVVSLKRTIPHGFVHQKVNESFSWISVKNAMTFPDKFDCLVYVSESFHCENIWRASGSLSFLYLQNEQANNFLVKGSNTWSEKSGRIITITTAVGIEVPCWVIIIEF